MVQWDSRTFSAFFEGSSPHGDEVTSSDLAFTLEVEMPGMRTEDVSIETKKGILTIRAERKGAKRTRKVARTYRLPDGVNDEAIEATLAEGILTVVLPKREGQDSRKISVRAN